MLPRGSRFGLIPLGSCLALMLSSCGGEDSFGKRYAVAGNVTYNGQPLERGLIAFVPDKGTGATGTIENGSYTLSTGGEQDGALPGKYKVTITAIENTEAKAKAQFAKEFKKSEAEITAIPRQYLANAANNAKNLIPAGYGDVRTTTLSAEVKEQSNTIPFDLTDAGAPPEPPKKTSTNTRGRQ